MSEKKVILGISGGIAAYKSPLLIRLMVKKGWQVKTVVTESALQFVTETTLQTLSQNRVYRDMFSSYMESATEHISLAQWADIMVIAPSTANIIGKIANGIADDALSTTFMAFDKQVFVAPAMNDVMYASPAVKRNIQVLQECGVKFIEAEDGFLACGTSGKGRMAEPEEIMSYIEKFSEKKMTLEGKRFMVTAGPTREQIDSVRFISNNSSGRMGVEIAKELADRGALVDLVIGPVSIELPQKDNLHIHKVISAGQMYEKATECFALSDCGICSAAVADYTPENAFNGKMKKKDSCLEIKLKPTKDILKSLGESKTAKQKLVGFALETDNELVNAKDKLERKNLDFIVLNSLRDKGAGFEYDTNKVTFIDRDGETSLPLKAKSEVAKDIIDKIETIL